MQSQPTPQAHRLNVAREACRWLLGALLDCADDAALSSYTVDELLGPPNYPVCDISDYAQVRRRAKPVAARVLIGLAGEPAQLVARGADLLESVLEGASWRGPHSPTTCATHSRR
jgi:hypothetical protein